MRNTANERSMNFQNAAEQSGLDTVYGFAESGKQREKMETPTAFVPDERVHFVDFVFGKQILSPNIFILIICAKHRGNPIAKNTSCRAKTKTINDTKRLGLRDNKKIAVV